MLRLFTAVFSVFGASLKPFGGLLGAIFGPLGGTLGPHAFLERVSWGAAADLHGGTAPIFGAAAFSKPFDGVLSWVVGGFYACLRLMLASVAAQGLKY